MGSRPSGTGESSIGSAGDKKNIHRRDAETQSLKKVKTGERRGGRGNRRCPGLTRTVGKGLEARRKRRERLFLRPRRFAETKSTAKSQ
jgi:hypothetical protein